MLEAVKNSDLIRQSPLVGGEWVACRETFPVDNPATQEVIAEVGRANAKLVEEAIEKASVAWPEWRRKTVSERGQLLQRWHDLMLEHKDDLALIMTAEQGKPLAESSGEIEYAASFIEWFAEQGKRVNGEVLPGKSASDRILVTKEPVGVCALITPWNFPAAMITRKATPALAAGCPVVIKPAESTPLSALALGFLAMEAGIPAGVLNIVAGDAPEIGKTLLSSPTVRKLSFTGSTAVGKLLMRQAADTVKQISLELGGNAPFVVFDDADLDKAAEGAMVSKFRNGGQTCVCANRIYVQRAVYGDFAERLADKMGSELKLGAGTDPDTTMGPLINQAGIEKVQEHIADAKEKGATVQLGGGKASLGGLFFEPTLLTGMDQSMQIAKEETFGPVAALFPFESESELVEMANATRFGLAAYFYSENVNRIFRVAEALEYGILGINTGMISNPMAPFGGMKESGLGREGSTHGIEEYLETKYWCLGSVM